MVREALSAWQRNAMSAADKASAASLIAALKNADERKRAADATGPAAPRR
jgi:hypothetical protein